MTAIDEHLAERLSDYQHRIEREHENSRRLNALLAAAPPDLQREWKELLGDVPESAEFSRMTKAEERSSGSSLISGVRQSTQATIAELYGDMSITTMDLATETIEPLRSRSSTLVEVEDEVDVLPFTTARPSATIAKPPMEKTTKPIDFARILSLPPQHLAALLSSLDSQTVLLALAGSTPEFMRSFAKLLTPRDAKSLTSKLQLIGPINLRDVDEAQHRIVERAASMLAALEVDRRQAA